MTVCYILLIVLGIFSLCVSAICIFVGFRLRKKEKKNERIKKTEKTVPSLDELTGLYSEQEFDEAVRGVFATREYKNLYILHIDIDNFSFYRSVHGKEASETALKYVAFCIQDFFDGKLIACRNASDHFYVLSEGTIDKACETILQWYDVLMRSIAVHAITMHFGIYAVNDLSVPVSEMRSYAKVATRSVKENYGNLIGIYNEELFLQQQTRMELASSFETSLKHDKFVVMFQPKYDACSEKIAGAEALVRWMQDDGSLTSPSEFIPVLEHTGLIPKLDFYVFEEVCKTMAAFFEKNINMVPISVNFSRINLYNPGFCSKLLYIAERYGIPHKSLEIELTESAFFENEKILTDIAKRLRQDDFRVSIDDFGRGYSSLNLIKEESFDVIKIDQSFLQGENEDTSRIILKTILSLTRELRLETVAEGVENRTQLEFLKNSGCDLIQGFFFSKPVSKQEFESMLELQMAS
ncbi:MAG: bifunctional diguanylate cyclase/phosphodiesterase [Treponemataceae bacterium]|nr:bifunctional diguanylate cyclase/phosphodiesterase [Treponemataceae bacterium]